MSSKGGSQIVTHLIGILETIKIDKVNNSNIEAFVHYIYYIAHGHEGAKKAVAQSL